MAKKNDDPVTTEQIQSLLERVHAREDRITRAQLQTFLHRPVGPTVSDACVEILRLPEEYGTDSTHGGGRLAVSVLDLVVSPTGDLWLATVIDGTIMIAAVPNPVLNGLRVPNVLFNLTKRVESSDESLDVLWPRIIGFQPNGMPVTHCVRDVFVDRVKDVPSRSPVILVGNSRVSDIPDNFAGIRVAPDGAVLTAHWFDVEPSLHRRHKLFRNGEQVGDTGDLGDLFVLDDGRIVVTRSSYSRSELWTLDEDGSDEDDVMIARVHGEDDLHREGIIRAVRGTIGDLQLTIENRSGYFVAQYTNPDQPLQCSVVRELGPRYIGHDAVLPDGRTVYVGKAFRDGLQCLVVDGVPQEPFERVTGVVRYGDAHRYFGVTGRHLFMMELPPRAPHNVEGRTAIA